MGDRLRVGSIIPVRIDGASDIVTIGVVTKIRQSTIEGFWLAKDINGKADFGPLGTTNIDQLPAEEGYMSMEDLGIKIANIIGITDAEGMKSLIAEFESHKKSIEK